MVKFVDGVVLGAAARACSALGVLFWSSPRRQVAESLIAGLDRAGCRRAIHWRGALGLHDFRFRRSARTQVVQSDRPPFPTGLKLAGSGVSRAGSMDVSESWARIRYGRVTENQAHLPTEIYKDASSLLVLVLLKQTPGLVPQTLPLPTCPSARRPSCRRNGPARS